MKLYNYIPKPILFFMAAVSTLLLTSCGSYQYAGTSNDGIYGDTEQVQVVVPAEIEYGTRVENGDYYKRLFEEEAALYGEVLADDAIFTDVDAYSSTENYDYNNQNSNYQGGNAPWGNDPDSYSINIYNNGFYGGFNPYGINGLYGFDPFWGPGNFYGPYGSGFYSPFGFGPGFYSPYGYGFGYGRGFGFGHGYGYGIGFSVHPFIYGGGGYYNPYSQYSSRQHNFRQNVAYNSGRRGTYGYNSNRNNAIRNASTLDNRGRSSSYSRSIRNIRNSNDEYGITRRITSSRTYNTRSNSDGSYSRSRSSGTYSRSNSNSNSNRSSSSTARSNSNRSSSPTVRSSSNSGRSSSTARSSSSGSSSRSSSGRGRDN